MAEKSKSEHPLKAPSHICVIKMQLFLISAAGCKKEFSYKDVSLRVRSIDAEDGHYGVNAN